jgi:soluble lytic murein transglycosylase
VSNREVRWGQPRLAAFNNITSQSESGGRDYYPGGAPVTSPKGARYSMQVMPSTAADPGFGVAPAQSNTPQEFNRVGSQYLNALHQRYGGDPAKMWAAYNWGPGNLDAALQRHGVNWLQFAPKETQNYVAQNLRALGGY